MLVNYNSNYDPSAPWANGIRSIGSIMATMPAIRANAASRMAEARYRDSATSEMGAQTELTGEKTIGERLKNQMSKSRIDGSARTASALNKGAQEYAANGKFSASTFGDILQGLGEGLQSEHPEGAATALQHIISLYSSMDNPNDPRAAAMLGGDADKLAVADANNTAKAAEPVVVGNDASLFSKQGVPLGEAAYTLAPGASRFPAKSFGDRLRDQSNLSLDQPEGTNQKPAPAAAPALPASVQAEVFKSLLANEGGGTNTVTALTGLQKAMGGQTVPTAASAGAMVRVQHPNGQTGMIPAANLKAALQQGYKQLQ